MKPKGTSVLVGAVVLVLASAGLVSAQAGKGESDSGRAVNVTRPDTAEAAMVSCRLSIDRVMVVNGELYDTLDIIVESSGVDLAGCMLKLGVASAYVDIVNILPGEIMDSCRWNMFRASEVGAQSTQFEQVEVWQVTALAQGFTGGRKPVCFHFDRPVSLARIVVSSLHVPVVPDTTAAIFFLWESCRDNVISDREGASILISDTVTSSFPVELRTVSDRFPSLEGTPSECISRRAVNKPRRLVEFNNGGVEFRLDLDLPEADSL